MSDPFTDLAAFVAVPRVGGLVLSPDGRRLVVTVSAPAADGKTWVPALWDVDPEGVRQAAQLTRSAKGDSAPAFLPGGDLLFLSSRPEPAARPDPGVDDDVPALWLLPAAGGEPRRVATRPGGVAGAVVARGAGTVVVGVRALPGTVGPDQDAAARTERKDRGVSAILHTGVPVRYWDHDLGPGESRLLVLEGDLDAGSPPPARDLTPEPGRALEGQSWAVTPDGGMVVTGWQVPLGRTDWRSELVAIDVADGSRHVLAADEGPASTSYDDPVVSPDGRWAVATRGVPPTYDSPPRYGLELVDLAAGVSRDLTPDFDGYPHQGSPVFSPGSDAVYFTADAVGHRPVFRVDVATGAVEQVTEAGAYAALSPAPDGRFLYALRSSYAHPARPVRIDLADPSQQLELPAPGALDDVPGRLEQVTTPAPDGTCVHSWLLVPAGATPAEPAPLVLWIHGGPLGSNNDWNWRWCPQLLVARGYAVLMPDPALSTGYGMAMIERGWGQWGGTPYTDLMAATDAALERPELDATRTAAMGGSYGGYLTNWIAGHTDRFDALVTHASIWALDQFQGTTDHPGYWAREWGHSDEQPERYTANSPHLHADAIRTPMLVIHGDKDYRVPIGEGLRLWHDLVRRGVEAQFLYFPDENHWVLTPGNAQVWYDTVLAFLDQHVLGAEPRRL